MTTYTQVGPDLAIELAGLMENEEEMNRNIMVQRSLLLIRAAEFVQPERTGYLTDMGTPHIAHDRARFALSRIAADIPADLLHDMQRLWGCLPAVYHPENH